MRSAIQDIETADINYDTNAENISLSKEVSIIFKRINAARQGYVGKYQDPTPAIFKSIIQSAFPKSGTHKIVDPRQEELYELFNESNLDFFENFFGDRKNLFEKPRPYKEEESKARDLSIEEVATIFSSIVSTRGIIKIQDEEIDLIRDLSIRLLAEGSIARSEALALLKLASRARPNGSRILSKIDELRRT